MTNLTCHSCGATMEPGYCARFECPQCSHIWDGSGPQREYNTGRPCPCAECAALVPQLRPRAAPLTTYLGLALREIIRASVTRRPEGS